MTSKLIPVREHSSYLQHRGNRFKHTWWKCQVEKTISNTLLHSHHLLIEMFKIFLLVIAPCKVMICCPELLQQLLLPLLGLHCPCTLLPQLGHTQPGPGIAKYLSALNITKTLLVYLDCIIYTKCLCIVYTYKVCLPINCILVIHQPYTIYQY